MAKKEKQELAQEFENLNQELIKLVNEENRLKDLEDDYDYEDEELDLDEEFPPDEPFAVVDQRGIDYEHIEEDDRYILVDNDIILSRLNPISKLAYIAIGSHMKNDIHALNFQQLAKNVSTSEQIAYDALDALLMYLEVDQVYLPDSWQKAMDAAKQLLDSTDKEALSDVK